MRVKSRRRVLEEDIERENEKLASVNLMSDRNFERTVLGYGVAVNGEKSGFWRNFSAGC